MGLLWKKGWSSWFQWETMQWKRPYSPWLHAVWPWANCWIYLSLGFSFSLLNYWVRQELLSQFFRRMKVVIDELRRRETKTENEVLLSPSLHSGILWTTFLTKHVWLCLKYFSTPGTSCSCKVALSCSALFPKEPSYDFYPLGLVEFLGLFWMIILFRNLSTSCYVCKSPLSQAAPSEERVGQHSPLHLCSPVFYQGAHCCMSAQFLGLPALPHFLPRTYPLPIYTPEVGFLRAQTSS